MTKIGNVWVFIEQEGGKIADVSLELVCKENRFDFDAEF